MKSRNAHGKGFGSVRPSKGTKGDGGNCHFVKTIINVCTGMMSVFWAVAMGVTLLASNVRAADYVIVVDVSGSMADPISRQDKRIRVTTVQEALRQYLPALPEGSRVDLLAFNNGIVSELEVVLSDPGDLKAALSWIEGLAKEAARNKGTYLWSTLRHALTTATRYSQENPDQPTTVRVLTDGVDNEKGSSLTLEKVLEEFRPVLDGQRIRSNLVLLGDLELKTKLSLPEGAFETTSNPNWEVLLPPIILCAPATPSVGDQISLFENNPRSVFKTYEWLVDGVTVGHDKVLTWQAAEPRNYKITLRVTGLQGTMNSATVFVRVKERARLTVDFIPSTTRPDPRQEVKFIGRCSSPGAKFIWTVDAKQVAESQDLTFQFEEEGTHTVKLVACDADGRRATNSQSLLVKEPAISARIKGPAEIAAGHPVQFASEISGPCASVEWNFGDGATNQERNPLHTFKVQNAEFRDCTVSLRVVSALGKVIYSAPHTVRVWAEKKVPAPEAKFRVLNQNARVGDAVQLVDETTGAVDSATWTVDGEVVSADRNPEIRMKNPGSKTVRLMVRGPGGESTTEQQIVVIPRFVKPVAWCGASKLHGTAPLTVQFTNRIQGDFKSILWQFGDGQVSTNDSPSHTFATATNFTATLTVFPMADSDAAAVQKLTITADKPWPAWAKLIAAIAPCLLLITSAALLLHRRRLNALKLPVYYWAEQSQVCKTALLTKANETFELSPTVPVRLKREGKSRSLIAHPLHGATLVGADGHELPMLTIGDGLRVTVKDAGGQTRVLAISILQKPRRPAPAAGDPAPMAEGDVCGFLDANVGVQAPEASAEFNWGWNETTTAKHD